MGPLDLLRRRRPAAVHRAWRSSSRSSPRTSAADATLAGRRAGEATGDAPVAARHRLAVAARRAPPREPRWQRPDRRPSSGVRPDPVRGTGPRRRVPAGAGPTRPLPVAGVHPRHRGPPRRDRRATRSRPNRDRRRSPHRRAAPHPGRAGGGPDPRRSDIRFVGDRVRRAGRRSPGRSASPGELATRSGPSCSRRSTRPPGTRTRRSAWASSSASSRSPPSFAIASAGLGHAPRGIGVVFIAIAIEGVAAGGPARALAASPSASPTRRIAHPYRAAARRRRRDPAGRVRRREPLAGRPLRRGQLPAGGHRVRGRSRAVWCARPVAPDDAALVRRGRRRERCRRTSSRLSGTTPLPIARPDARRASRCCRSRRRCRSSSWRSIAPSSAGLLCTSESRELRRQVETLKESRSAVLDVEASELHRIERDLHDGAQQRLVMLNHRPRPGERADRHRSRRRRSSSSSRARSRRARRWPSSATSSAGSRRRSCSTAASCRRSDRSPAAGPCRRSSGATCRPASGCRRRSSGPPTSSSPRRSRTSPSTARRRRCEVRCRREGSRLVVEVWDDGVGGATVEPGGGLAGLAGRVAGVDGTFTVSSPAGGPTLVRAELPVAAWAAPAVATGAAGARSRGRSAPRARGGGRSASRAARACRRCC